MVSSRALRSVEYPFVAIIAKSTVHILFDEQAVYEKGYKTVKILLGFSGYSYMRFTFQWQSKR